jgi:ABC-type phosphate transport system substrate-binding protein
MGSVLALLGLLTLVATAGPAGAADFKVVIHASNPVSTLSTADLSEIFLKKNTRWATGSAIEPVDRAGDTGIRASFSMKAHGKSVGAIKSYWQRQIFSGRATPPPELSSDADVLAFIRSHPWAIGYVSAGVPAGDGIKEVPISD